MWSGSFAAIPTGWLLCDGTNNTPDLRDRFIVGAGNSYGVGAKGGEATHTLTVAEMPSHNHSATLSLSGLSTNSAGEHTHSVKVINPNFAGNYARTIQGSGDIADSTTASTNSAGGHTHTISGSGSVTVNSNGSGSAHENRPPYYALCFIMKQ